MDAYSTSAHCQLNIEAISNNFIDIPNKEYHTVQYKVCNPDNISHRFTVQDILGMIVLAEGPNDCHQQSKLVTHQSCIRHLKLPTKSLNHHGPSLCNARLTNCIEPKYDERLTVTTLPEGTPTISLQIRAIKHQDNANLSTFRGKACKHSQKIKKGVFGNTVMIDQDCNIEILSGLTAFNKSVLVFNTSSTNNDEALYPGEFCYFYYHDLGTGSSSTPQAQSFMVYPVSNSFDYNYQVNYNVELFNVGDYYPDSSGQQIFQLPEETSESFIYVMYTATPDDDDATDQDSALENCSIQGMELPDESSLQTLWDVSNFGTNHLINGFNCSSLYWSSTFETAVNFSNGQTSDLASTDPEYPSRCVTRWLFNLF